MKTIEWPRPGYLLYQEGGFVLSVCPTEKPLLAIFGKINPYYPPGEGTFTVIGIKQFKTKEAMLKWFGKMRKKHAHLLN